MSPARRPTPAPALPPLRVGWRTIAACWLAVGVFLVSRAYAWSAVGMTRMPWRENWGRVALSYAVCVLLWALFTPLILRLVERFPFRAGERRRAAGVHLAVGAALGLASVTVGWQLVRVLYDAPGLRFSVYLLSNLDIDLFLYLLTATGAYALQHYRSLGEQEVAGARLRARVAAAEVEGIKMRVDPRFVFSVLDSVGVMIRVDPEAADQLVSSLGDLLRARVQSRGTRLVALEDELGFAEPYLEIQRLRLPTRLSVRTRVDDEALGAQVPPFILHPLLDALVPGSPEGGGRVRLLLSARRSGDSLVLDVRDQRAGGERTDAEPAEGALRELRARLERIYGDRFSLEPLRGPRGWGGWRVVVPFAGEDAAALPGEDGAREPAGRGARARPPLTGRLAAGALRAAGDAG